MPPIIGLICKRVILVYPHTHTHTHTQRVGQLKGRIELSNIRAVEFVEMSAFNLAHTLQVSESLLVNTIDNLSCVTDV